MSKDPVTHCKLYREEGCAHVDGYLCDYETCEMRLEYSGAPGKKLKSSEDSGENKKLEKRV